MDWTSKSDPFVAVFQVQSNQRHELGRTETIQDNLNRDLAIQGQKKGSISVLAEEISQNNDAVDFQMRANKLDKKDFFGKSDPYVNIYRANEGNTWTLVKRTEVIKNTLDPSWRPFEMSVDALCRGDYDRSLKFEVLDWNSDGSFDY